MNKENERNNWYIALEKEKNVSHKRPAYIAPSDLEKAGDDLVWAIEAVIEHPMDIKRWFLVKDAIAKYKTVRTK